MTFSVYFRMLLVPHLLVWNARLTKKKKHRRNFIPMLLLQEQQMLYNFRTCNPANQSPITSSFKNSFISSFNILEKQILM